MQNTIRSVNTMVIVQCTHFHSKSLKMNCRGKNIAKHNIETDEMQFAIISIGAQIEKSSNRNQTQSTVIIKFFLLHRLESRKAIDSNVNDFFFSLPCFASQLFNRSALESHCVTLFACIFHSIYNNCGSKARDEWWIVFFFFFRWLE